ncbi:peptidoglycan recognition protein family protein [Trinickia mobilis]|uniref:peptidoglycan recognition protein family protein n=1 Tax=Trinickia mobilis TaxID=2816356 RepID=UPI001A8F081E|nr:peptidoglycan recognition family protein [Trinickia mobilis]
MLFISKNGHVDAERIIVKVFPAIERASMNVVNGIVVHQTDSYKLDSVFNSYKDKGANGAHFLIDKNGEIYQTASLFRRTNHVGRMQSRCIVTKKCTPAELKAAIGASKSPVALTKHEMKKSFPDRFPSNEDSIGIELVGKAIGPEKQEVYEAVTDQQNASLKWLIGELVDTLNVSIREVYRHPEIGRKNLTEAGTAKW